jgi:hypothetical protein
MSEAAVASAVGDGENVREADLREKSAPLGNKRAECVEKRGLRAGKYSFAEAIRVAFLHACRVLADGVFAASATTAGEPKSDAKSGDECWDDVEKNHVVNNVGIAMLHTGEKKFAIKPLLS